LRPARVWSRFLPVDDEVVAIHHGLGAQAREVRARVGFGIALAPDVLAREDLGQVVRALFFGAVLDQQRADHGDAHVGRAAHAPALLLFDENDELFGRQAHAAVLRGPAWCHPAFLRQFEEPVLDLGPAQTALGVAQFARVFGFEKCAHRGAEALVIHGIPVGAGGGCCCGVHAFSCSVRLRVRAA